MIPRTMRQLAPYLVRSRFYIAFAGHLVGAAVAYVAAWWLRFDGAVSPEYQRPALLALPVLVGIRGVFVYRHGLMRGMSRYFGSRDVLRIGWAVGLSEAVFLAYVFIAPGKPFPRSVFVLDAMFAFLIYAGARLILKHLRPAVQKYMYRGARAPKRPASTGTAVPTLIVGAGDLGEATLRLLEETLPGGHHVIGFLDDDPVKAGVTINGHAVLGPVSDLTEAIRRYGIRDVIVAIGSPPPALVQRVVRDCAGTGVKARIVPTLRGLLSGELRAAPLREVALEDLLGREPITLERTAVEANLQGRCVLVTGAGGSIGSELARQIAGYRPSHLVLLDNGESALFEIDRELGKLAPEVKRTAIVGDIRDAQTVDRVFRTTRPQRVFHAAAYKHVPLMESHPLEAVWNNVRGTVLVAQAAETYQAESFLMISTDKAVRPTNVMGASKRCAELAVVNMPRRQTTFVAVRFGNVLGSNGSVVPIFARQIAEGGPVTVTHPDIERFFMTIPEAVELVLQANAQGKPGDVFVLDMGKPVRIADLARNMIILSGRVPDQDIPVVFTGLRPGEKLYEELVAYGEELQQSGTPRLGVLRHVNGVDRTQALWRDINDLIETARGRDPEATRAKLWNVVRANDPDVPLNGAESRTRVGGVQAVPAVGTAAA
jgi:FlaA1/EpsC-like NDP-sugar epimerase